MRYLYLYLLMLALLVLPMACSADIIDFEILNDSNVISNQFSAQGVQFANAVALAAGISLNDAEFPPKSGAIVAAASGAPLEIDFTTPVSSFLAFFTYSEKLTLQVFDPANNLLATIHSNFSNNEAISGDAGSSPNEQLGLAASSIGRITVTNADLAAGLSFIVMDDVTFAPAQGGATVPEPSAFILLSLVLAALALSQATAGPWRERLWRQKPTTLDTFVRLEVDSAS